MSAAASVSAPSLATARKSLVDHQLYRELTSRTRLRVFMKHHVFAVWDFFSLLKRLQVEVTCVSVPWTPRYLGDHARFITEIVVAEECDEGLNGEHLSHFELYLSAMDEVGADKAPIEGLMRRIEGGASATDALESPDIPQSVQDFVATTLKLAMDGAPHEVAASFCHGRENLLPDVLAGARDGMHDVLDEAPIFKHYLERHITLDHDEHGPLAMKLLAATCDGDPARMVEAGRVAVEAVEARSRLWDGILAEIRASEI